MNRLAFSLMILVLLVKQFKSRLILTMGLLYSIMAIFQAHVFSSGPGQCAAFLANYHAKSAARVIFNNMHYNLPPWSISILPDCRNVVFNTARVSTVLVSSQSMSEGKATHGRVACLCIVLLDQGLIQISCP